MIFLFLFAAVCPLTGQVAVRPVFRTQAEGHPEGDSALHFARGPGRLQDQFVRAPSAGPEKDNRRPGCPGVAHAKRACCLDSGIEEGCRERPPGCPAQQSDAGRMVAQEPRPAGQAYCRRAFGEGPWTRTLKGWTDSSYGGLCRTNVYDI